MEGGVEASSGLSVSHETIYQAIHALPRGELKKELLTCFRQDKPHRGRRSKVGTLVERTSGKVVLIKLTDAKASTTRDGFVEGMLRIPAPLRLTMTYD